MTRAYKEFATTHLFEKWGRTLMPKAKQVLTDIINVTGLSVTSEDVARDLKDLVHELSKDALLRISFQISHFSPVNLAKMLPERPI